MKITVTITTETGTGFEVKIQYLSITTIEHFSDYAEAQDWITRFFRFLSRENRAQLPATARNPGRVD